jgi:starvation-inducible outer membrane lipoprotein
LYDSLGWGDAHRRHELSRAADVVLYALAARVQRAILVNWWNHDTSPAQLARLGGTVVKVFCDCRAATAAVRVQARRRRPGHLDPEHSPEEVAERVATVEATYRGPLRLGGKLLSVDTSGEVTLDDLVRAVEAAIAGPPTGAGSKLGGTAPLHGQPSDLSPNLGS